MEMWSMMQFNARFLQLRDNLSYETALAQASMGLEKSFDHSAFSATVRREIREGYNKPFFPSTEGELQAQIVSRLPPEEAASHMASLLGRPDSAVDKMVAKAKELADEPLNAIDYQRLATSKMEAIASKAAFVPYDRRFFWKGGRFAYGISFGMEPSAKDDLAYRRGFERFLKEGHADAAYKEEVWSIVNAPSSRNQIHTFARWYEQACPIIHLTRPDYTASLATTAITSEEPVIPWRSTLIELPQKVVPYNDGGWVRSILVHRHNLTPDESVVWDLFVYPWSNHPVIWSHGQPWTTWSAEAAASEDNSAFLDDESLRFKGDESLNDVDIRCLTICRRIAAGVCHAMSSKDDWRPTKSTSKPRSSRKRDQDEPIYRVYLMGRPVKVDCRIAVRQYVEKGTKNKGPLTLQLLVRGHWRRQAIGPGRKERKWIRIEPYWKGPEDAPIRTSPREL